MKNILITGPPGIGKTTLMKKIVDRVKERGIECNGFYTEEVRHNAQRIGFDIVSLTGNRAILARKGTPNQNERQPTVGQYSVHVQEFEKLAIPVFEMPKKLLIIDEIGKMEMFSKKFEECVKKIMNDTNIRVIATVPLKGGPLLVKQLKENERCELINVNRSNRDTLIEDIMNLISL